MRFIRIIVHICREFTRWNHLSYLVHRFIAQPIYIYFYYRSTHETTRSGSKGDRLSTLPVQKVKIVCCFDCQCKHYHQIWICKRKFTLPRLDSCAWRKKKRAARLVESIWIVVVGSAVGHIVYALAHEDKCMENSHIWRVHLHVMKLWAVRRRASIKYINGDANDHSFQ